MGATSPHDLKRLQTKAAERLTELADLRAERDQLTARINAAQADLDSINRSIEQATAAAPIVTEHALLRYLERVRGVCLDEVRREILTPKVLAMIDQFQSGKFPVNGVEKPFRAVVKQRAVVTIEEV